MIAPLPINNSLGWPIVLKQVSLHLKGKTILQNIDLNFSEDEGTIAILGGNGAGKSQLLRILNGLIKPSFGEITWAGSSQASDIRKAHLLIATQQPPFRRSVLENILLSLKLCNFSKPEATIQAHQALEACGLVEFASWPARQLSSGEKQLLILAQAWAVGAKTLLLDEPTSHLDPPNTQKIENIIANLEKRGSKIILVTHDIVQAKRLAGRVIFLDQARILEDQKVEEFFTNPTHPTIKQYLHRFNHQDT